MRPGWVAGSVRARLLASRRLGRAGAHALAGTGPEAAVDVLAASPYGRDVHRGMDLVAAQRAVRATALWHLRVLAGWLPSGRSEVLRVLAGEYELANVEAHLDELAGRARPEPFELGALATAWPVVRRGRSVAEVRRALAGSAWGDPGTDEQAPLGVALLLAADRRIVGVLPELRRLAAAHAAILVAAERFVFSRELSPSAVADAQRLLGPLPASTSLEPFVAGLPSEARWVFADAGDPAQLWKAEAAWWRARREQATRGIHEARSGRATVAWSALLLLGDARDVCGALEAAEWGRTGVEAFDAVA